MTLFCKGCKKRIDLPTKDMTYCQCKSVWALRNEVGGLEQYIYMYEKKNKKVEEKKE